MKISVRLSAILLAVCLVFSLLPVPAQAAAHDNTHALCMETTCGHDNPHIHTPAQSWKQWTSSTSLPTSGTYYLTRNVNISSQWKPSDELRLCLNGYTVTYTGKTASNVYTYGAVNVSSGQVYITNCQNTGGFTMSSDATAFAGGSSSYSGLIYVSSAELHLYNVDVYGVRGDAGVCVYGNPYGAFYMHGGSIRNCDIYGGGLFASLGGNDRAEIELYSDATIRNNTSDYLGTGGVTLSGATKMYITDNASIKDNTAELVGGVDLGVQCVLYMYQNSSISGNKGTRDAGGINNDGTVYMYQNASVTGNRTVSGYGGGIYMSGRYTDCLYVSGGVKITGNTRASGTVSNVYIPNNYSVRTIRINGTMTADADIGVSMYTPSTFTSNWNAKMSGKTPGDYFFADSNKYTVAQSGNELTLQAHNHEWTYTLGTTAAAGDTLNAECFCGETGKFTIAPPALVSGTGSAAAAVSGTVSGVTKPSVKYVGTGSTDYAESTTAPTAPGTYKAAITLGGVTAAVEYALIYPNVTTTPAAADITYGDTLSEAVLTGGAADVAGTFTWADGSIAPDAGTWEYDVIFTPDDPAFEQVTVKISVTVNKAASTVTTLPAASGLTYGETLSDSTLTGGEASVSGTFVWADDSVTPVAGTTMQSVIFTPDNENYETVTLFVPVTVEKATPDVSVWPTAEDMTYGETLSDSALTDGEASVPGTFTWSQPDTVPGVGEAEFDVIFTPADTANYNTVTGKVYVVVEKAAPMVTAWPTAEDITYGDSLSDAVLTGGEASVSGTFTWSQPDAMPDAGTAEYEVTFTPADGEKYSTVTGTVSVKTEKAVPAVTVRPTAEDMTYGETLSDSALTGGEASVSGTFEWADDSRIPIVGTTMQSVIFTPDNENYETVTLFVPVTVEKATPDVTAWPTAENMTYGETLSDSALTDGEASVPGTFTWSQPDTVPGVGEAEFDVIFTPADTANYNTVTGKVYVTVEKAAPMVTAWPTAEEITYGDSLSDAVLTGGEASVSGTFAWSQPDAMPDAGTAEYEVTFTPADGEKYSTVTGTVSVKTEKAVPAVTVQPAAEDITYGDALSASALTGGEASVSGTFDWADDSLVPVTGTAMQSVIFTPDNENYETVTLFVSVTVEKATPDVTAWPVAEVITYGETLSDSVLTDGEASVSGTFAWVQPDTAPGVGTGEYDVVFTPADTANYNTVTGKVYVTVEKAAPMVTAWPTAEDITYGDSLSDSILTGGEASVSGTFAWVAPESEPDVGTAEYEVRFTPADMENYSAVTQKISVTVRKAAPVVTSLTASDLIYGQSLSASVLTGTATGIDGTELSGIFVWDDDTVKPSAGTGEFGVTFIPDDNTNYTETGVKVSLFTEKANPVVTEWPTASDMTYGSSMWASTLIGGTADVSGKFEWRAPTHVPDAGTAECGVTFVPDDTENYRTVQGNVTVNVKKAVPEVTQWPSATNIVYGEALSTSGLSGGAASVPGTFGWTDGTEKPGTGILECSVTFTPEDTDNYETVTGMVSIMVELGVPNVTEWPVASGITYGDALSDSALIGGEANVDGTFSWDEPETVPGAGTKQFTVVFEPEDTNYIPVKMTVEIVVDKAVPTVKWDAMSYVRDETGEAIDIPAPMVTVPYGEYTGSFRYAYAPADSDTFQEGLPAAAGTYIIRGEIAESENFTAAYGTVLVTVLAAGNDVHPMLETVTRVYGSTRYDTSFKAADTLKDLMGVDKFQNIIVASGENFPDALAGSYLASVTEAPILLVNSRTVESVKAYIRENLAPGGTVYLLGGTGVVPVSMETGLTGFTVKRLGGATRYDTNLKILLEAGIGDKDILVCSAFGFADSLSASATGLPVMLVGNSLTPAQKTFLESCSGSIIIVGGWGAVSNAVESQLTAYGPVERLSGSTRYETSIMVAERFFENPTGAVLAYATNFPDGLSGGPIANRIGAPLILTRPGLETAAAQYAAANSIHHGFVLGGPTLITDKAVRNIFSLGPDVTIVSR